MANEHWLASRCHVGTHRAENVPSGRAARRLWAETCIEVRAVHHLASRLGYGV